MKCCECGAEINHVLVNHFDHDGTDRLHVMELEDLGDGCYSVLTDASWTGYGLETEDCLADVYCPKCGKMAKNGISKKAARKNKRCCDAIH